MEGYRTPEQLREELKRRYAAKDWPVVRMTVFKRDGFRCRTCGTGKNLRCHHKTYVHLWDELNHLEEMATQCKSCHHPGSYGDFTISEDRAALFWLKVASAAGRGLRTLSFAFLKVTWWVLKKVLVAVYVLTAFILVNTLGPVVVITAIVTSPIWRPLVWLGFELHRFKKEVVR